MQQNYVTEEMICGGQKEGGFELKGVASRQVGYAKAENEEYVPMLKILTR